MFVMIFVNNLSPVPNSIVPWWMKHFHGPNGMTFVDLVYPGFLFIVGMSIPFGLQSRLNKGEPAWRVLLHVALRALSLLFIGLLMVNGTPDSAKMGWPGPSWVALMYTASILAFSSFGRTKGSQVISTVCRAAGLAGMLALAFAFRGKDDGRIISFSPFYIAHQWWGILGAIGWCYLLNGAAFLLFGSNVTALLGWAVLLMCVYPGHVTGMVNGAQMTGGRDVGVVFGSHPAITAFGLVLGAMLQRTSSLHVKERTKFTVLLTIGCLAGAWLLYGLYGISKEQATPSWCLIGCAVTAALWLLFYWAADLRDVKFISKPFSLAGENVLLAYLLSYLLPAALLAVGLGDWYARLAEPLLLNAVARAVGCSILVLAVTCGLNRLGFRLKL